MGLREVKLLEHLLKEVLRLEHNIEHRLSEVDYHIRQIERRLPQPLTPTSISFQETSMNLPDPGQTLVFTGTIAPTGAAFPAGTTFTATSVDPLVTVTLDPTGLIVTAAIDTTDVAGTVADITWSTSTFTPSPTGSPASLTATIPLTIGTPPPPPTPTPTAVSFTQTS